MSTELVEVQNAVAAMNKVETGLAALRKEYGGIVYAVRTPEGMELARIARRLIREPRYEVEKIRKAAKAPILALGKKLDTEAARITRELTLIEAPIDQQITQEEGRIAAEKEAAINAELARVRNIQGRITEIREAPTKVAASNQAVILEMIAEIERLIIDSSFAEFEQEAVRAKAATMAALRGLHSAAVARELDDQRIAAERAELEKLRAVQAERDRQDKIKRDEEDRIAEEARRAEAARVAGEQRAQREAFEKEQREARERQAAEDRRIAEDRQKLEDERKRLQPPPARKRVHNPGSEAIVEVVAHFYSVDKTAARSWLREIDWETAPA
jgi:hypothetical protein